MKNFYKNVHGSKRALMFMIAIMIALLVVARPSYASVNLVQGQDYLFDEYEATVDGVYIHRDAETQIWHVDGTTTGATIPTTLFEASDLYEENELGYEIDDSKDYAIYYEYLNGSITTPTSIDALRFYFLADSNVQALSIRITDDAYLNSTIATVIPSGNEASSDDMFFNFAGGSGRVFDEFEFKLHVIELGENDFDLFTNDYSVTVDSVSLTVSNGNQIMIDGTNEAAETSVDLSSIINTAEIDSDAKYLVSTELVSGSLTATSETASAYDLLFFDDDDLTFYHSVTSIGAYYQYADGPNAVIVDGNDLQNYKVYVSGSSSALKPNTWNEYTFKINVQEVTDEIIPEDTIKASDLGLQVYVYGNLIDVDDYFAFVVRDNTYQLVSNVSEIDYNYTYFEENYVNIFNLLNNGTYGITIEFGDGSTLYQYEFKEISLGIGGTNETDVQFSGTSFEPEISINDIGENVRQYNVYDDNVLDKTFTSSYYRVSKYVALIITIPEEEQSTGTVNYYVDGSIDSTDETVLNSLLVRPDDPVKADNIFIGWFRENETLWDFSSDIVTLENLNLYAKFVADSETVYTVTFDTGLGSELDDRLIVENETVERPNDPVLYGHRLIGWYTDEVGTELYDFDTPITDDLTLYAAYEIGEFTITFESNGGTDVDPITALYGSDIVKPANPTRTGYSFGGWFTDEELTQAFTFDTMPGADLTLYAKWTPAAGSGAIISPEDGGLTTFGWVLIGAVAVVAIYLVTTKNKKKK